MSSTMNTIIRSEKNAAFLEEAEARGYKPYVNHLKSSQMASTPNFYLGSVQLRLTDRFGTRYFIGIDMYDMDVLNMPRPSGPLSCSAEVQFHRENEDDDVVDVTISHKSFDETEGFFHRMWASMNFGYYEKTA
tara:strand:+ start:391 stop:789 length:399 start_codon:yes stop_codon:yes gene_type:complete